MDGARTVRQQVLPARECVAFTMDRGQVLRVVDLEGQQVTDVVAFNREDLGERLNAETTMLINRSIRPTTGQVLYSEDGRPMLTIVADTVGRNYLAGAMCSEEANFLRYGVRDTPNCRDNVARAVAPWGITKRQVQGALATFLNMVHHPDGRTEIVEPTSKPGDHIDLRAEMDLLVAVSNCPQERNPCNGWHPTPVEIVVYDPGASPAPPRP
jgi:urea carboxylase-associated protein 1